MAKEMTWRNVCMENSHRLLWEVVKWTRDPWRLHDKMGKLRGKDGTWLRGDAEKVGALVGDIMGEGKCTQEVAIDEGV